MLILVVLFITACNSLDLKLEGLAKIYYINLDRSVERNQYMITTLEGLNYQRVKAIDGKKDKLNHKEYVGRINRISNPEMACTLSHLKAIKQFLNDSNNTDQYAIIAEDDLSFDFIQYWKQPLIEYINQFDQRCEIIQLNNQIQGLDGYNYDQHTTSTVAYLVKRTAASKILTHTDRTKNFLADSYIYSNRVTCFHNPSLVTYRDDNDSLLHPTHVDIKRNSANKWIIDSMTKI